MQVQAVAVARQGDIAAVSVHARRCQHMRPVHGHALRLVDGRRIAVVYAVIVLQVERDVASVIGARGHALRADFLDRAKRAVLHAKAALVLQEHDTIPAGKTALATLDRATPVLPYNHNATHPRTLTR